MKFDLPGAHRLVCVQTDDTLQFLYVGNHEDCDRWIDRHKGLRNVIDAKTKRIAPVYEVSVGEPLPPRPRPPVLDADAALVGRLSEADLDGLNLRATDYWRLSALTAICSDDELQDAVLCVTDSEVQNVLLNVLLELRAGRIEAARAHISVFVGTAKRADDEVGLLGEAVRAPVNSDAVINLRDLSAAERKQLLSHGAFQDWLLFLHPDQKPVAHDDYAGSALLRGVSGSGKTCVIVHRAKSLAMKYPHERIAVLTLNPALASLIGDLVATACAPEVLQRIDCLSIAEFCRRLVAHYEPARTIQVHDPRSGETVEDAWKDRFDRPEQLQRLDPIIEYLARVRRLDAERYLRDEFIWVRSAFARSEGRVEGSVLPGRSAYLDPDISPRKGRSIAFMREWRELVLPSLEFFEDWSQAGGLYDTAGLVLLAHQHVAKLRTQPPPQLRYRAVLVDEVQDLGKTELELVRALAPARENGLFLSGDNRQQVFPKDHDLGAAGIEVSARRYFRKNYRNTRQVLEAGVALIKAFGPTEAGDDMEILDPEFSDRESARPIVVAAETAAREVEFVAHYIRLKRDFDQQPVCIVACGVRDDDEPRLVELQRRYLAAGLETTLLHRESRVRDGSVFLSALETVKGFEFSLVVVSQCSEAVIPVPDLPLEEAWRDASRLYVAFTRARDELVLTHSGSPSRFLSGVGGAVQWTNAVEQGLALLPAAPIEPELVEVAKPVATRIAPLRVVENPLSQPRPQTARARNDQLLAELQRLRDENRALQVRTHNPLKVSIKGGVSLYGLGRFPVTLYKDQWMRLLEAEERIRQFLREHDHELGPKNDDG